MDRHKSSYNSLILCVILELLTRNLAGNKEESKEWKNGCESFQKSYKSKKERSINCFSLVISILPAILELQYVVRDIACFIISHSFIQDCKSFTEQIVVDVQRRLNSQDITCNGDYQQTFFVSAVEDFESTV